MDRIRHDDFFTPEVDIEGDWQFVADPSLPDVLILGDSISIGYTRSVRHLLAGLANVHRAMRSETKPFNCGDTLCAQRHAAQWLGGRQWDVIHCNWGLHDLCYRNPEVTDVYGHRDKINGQQSVPESLYRDNLAQLLPMLASQCRQLIWAQTTVIPDGEAGRHSEDALRYNAAAAEVIAGRWPINDLYTLSRCLSAAYFIRPGDVHLSIIGSRLLASQVATAIRMCLPCAV